MPMINCPDCSKEISDAAPTCPNCGKPNTQIKSESRSVSLLLGAGILLFPLIFSWFTLRKGHTTVSRGVAFSWLVISLIILSTGDKTATKPNSVASSSAVSSVSNNTVVPAPQVSIPQERDSLTRAQKNAVRSAKNYLSFKGFSRDGLIEQLSSSAGDGYAFEDATIAVDSLDVDWNNQAVKAAKGYLDFQGFSCQGLIEQLSSSAGDKFTESEATYGAEQAGAC